jgi:hypothetical protein
MSDKNTGGPAFPHGLVVETLAQAVAQSGMTLRDYFAAKVMQGDMANNGETSIMNNAANYI